MSLISIVITLALAGFICWALLQIPMLIPFKNLIIGIIAFILVVWFLQNLGIETGLPKMRLK